MSNPVRMCIVCRRRLFQQELMRLQCQKGGVRAYSHRGRSFYICLDCVDLPKTPKQIVKTCRIKQPDLELIARSLKESIH